MHGDKGNEKGTPDDQKANQLAGKGTNLLSYLLPFFSTGGWTFPSGRGMAGGDKDHVKTRFQRQNRLYCPILKFSSAW